MNDTRLPNDWYFSFPEFFISFNVINLLLIVPLNVYIMVLCRSDPAEVFNLNQAVSNILYTILGPFQCLCSFKQEWCFFKPLGFLIGLCMSSRTILQCCVCVERYLAVVRPVFFLKYNRLRYRVAHSLAAWTSSLGFSAACMLMFLYIPYNIIAAMMCLIFAVDIFCCVSILKRLRHPAPGEREERREMDGVKKKAFQLVAVNMLLLFIEMTAITITFGAQRNVSYHSFGVAIAINMVINILTSLVQPAFVLHKAGKLYFIKTCCRSAPATLPQSTVCL